MGTRKPTRQWRRWHRWLGLAVAIPVLVLSVTGVLLNHIESLSWASRPLPPALARWYGAVLPDSLRGVSLEGNWYAQLEERLFINETNAFYCKGPLKGVVQVPPLIVAGCADELLLVAEGYQLGERIGPAYGLPDYEQLGRSDAGLILKRPEGLLRFDVNQLTSAPYSGPWQAVALRRLPQDLEQAILRQSVPESLNWQRFLQDLHAGRILGLGGQLLMDLAALVLAILAVTGSIIWARTRR